MSARSRAAFPVVLTTALVALAACGGEEAPGSTESPDEVTEEAVGANPYLDAADLCTRVPLDAVAAAAGASEATGTEAEESPPVSCRYRFRVPAGTGSSQLSATLQMLDGFGLERTGAGDAAMAVTGIGDEAWSRSHTDTYLLYARRDSLVFSVNVAGGDSESWPGMARSIAEVVLARL